MAHEAAADVAPHDAVEPSAVVDAPSSSSNEPVAQPPVEASAATASPKKKGRPPGAKDAKPRTRRPPVVRIEPIPQEPKEEPRPAKEKSVRASAADVSQVAQTPKPEIEELPPSPRTLYRETSKNLLALRGVIHANRRSHMEATISQKLAMWPLV